MSTLVSSHPDTAVGGVPGKHNVDCSDTEKPDYPNKKTGVEKKKKRPCYHSLECSDSDNDDEDPWLANYGMWRSPVPKKGYYKSCACENHDPCLCGGKVVYIRSMCGICVTDGEHETEECPRYASFMEMKDKECADAVAAALALENHSKEAA